MILGVCLDERIPLTRDVDLTRRSSLEYWAEVYAEGGKARATYHGQAKLDKLSALVLARLCCNDRVTFRPADN